MSIINKLLAKIFPFAKIKNPSGSMLIGGIELPATDIPPVIYEYEGQSVLWWIRTVAVIIAVIILMLVVCTLEQQRDQ